MCFGRRPRRTLFLFDFSVEAWLILQTLESVDDPLLVDFILNKFDKSSPLLEPDMRFILEPSIVDVLEDDTPLLISGVT